MPGLCALRFRKVACRVLVAATVFLTASLPAKALLTFDLRSTDSANPKLVDPPSGTNYVLHFDLYAVITGQDSDLTNEGIQDAYFSIRSTNVFSSGLAGNLALTLATPFDALNSLGQATASTGTIQDLDGDGDLDIGSNDSTVSDGWALARAASMQTGQSQYLLAHVTFTPTAPFLGGETDITVGVRQMTSRIVVPAVWEEDGHGIDPSVGGIYTSGAPVVIAVPEPSLLCLLLGPALALRYRRR